MGYAGVGWVMWGWGGLWRGGTGYVGARVSGSCRGGWVMQGWVDHVEVGGSCRGRWVMQVWGVSYRGGVGSHLSDK